jgi:serine/threonine protein kinase
MDSKAAVGGEAQAVNANDWKRAKELFSTAVALDEAERDAYIDSLPDSNEILDEVRSLLAAYLEAPDFLEDAVPELPPLELADEPSISLAGRRIGAWQLVREIGRGGMGVVWEARRADQQYEQRAAVKLLRASLLSDRDIRRFREERQILASLNHPCIARLLDGGMLEDGSPYLVMEYVDGLPLDAWCDSKNLSIRQRLETFLLVCSAVEYAHRQLVIHRDLKPANILVTASEGVPKLLDFGIAKLIDDGVEAQHSTTRLLTPECASPEQVRGERMTTANDVFSLGVLLYLLLTGHHPFALPDASPLEAMRAICEMEPRLPSSMAHGRRKELHGELDAIILQALRKNPAERYPSVRALADDIRAWLEGTPVSAIRQPWWRRSAKLIWRYKVQSAAIALAAVSLLAGILFTSIEAKHARQSAQEALVQKDHAQIAQHAAQADRDRAIAAQQAAIAAERAAAEDRNRANTEATTALSINEFLEKDLLAQAGPSNQSSANGNPNPDMKVRTALDRAAERIQGKFAGQPLVEASVRQTIGESYLDLGLLPEAQRQFERAVELRRQLLGEYAADTLSSMRKLAQTYRDQSRYPQAESLLKQVLKAQRTTLGENDSATLDTALDLGAIYYSIGRFPEADAMISRIVQTRRRLYPNKLAELFDAVQALASVCSEEGKLDAAERYANEAVEIARRLHGDDHPDTLKARRVLVVIYRWKKEIDAAEKLQAEVLAGDRRVLGPEHPRTLVDMNNLGVIYRLEGRYTESAGMMRQLLEISRRTNGSENMYTLAYENGLVQTLYSLGGFAEAEPLAVKNQETLKRVFGEDNQWTITSAKALGLIYDAEGRFKEAEPILLKVLEDTRRVQGAEHLNVATATTYLGVLYQDEGKNDLAEQTLAAALALDRKRLQPGELATRTCLTALARLRLTQRKYTEAESLLREAMDGPGNQNAQIWDTFDRQSLLGASLMGQGKYADAEPLLLSGYEGLQKQSPAISVDANLPEAGQRLVQLYTAWEKPDKADEWRRRLKAAE